MGGSRGGKHSKSKGKSKSTKSDTIKKKPELSNSKLDVGQSSNNDPNGANTNPETTAVKSKYTKYELEDLLYRKLQALYTKAKTWLLQSGYSVEEVERAILNNGYIHGPNDLLNNVYTNSVAFIKKQVWPKREAFKNMDELCKNMLETLVDSVMQPCPNMQRSDAMWNLLVMNWGFIPSTNILDGDQSTNSITACGSNGNSSSYSKGEDSRAPNSSSGFENVESLKKFRILERISLKPGLVSRLRESIPIATAAVWREIGSPVIWQQGFQSGNSESTEISDIISHFLRSVTHVTDEECLEGWLESNPDDPKIAIMVDLVRKIRELQGKVDEQKRWAEKKVIDSAKKLSRDLMDLRILRMEKNDKKSREDEKLCAEKSCILKLMETEQSLRNANCEVSFVAEAVRRWEIGNAQIRADTEALKLNASESKRELNEVLKREKRCMKKLAEMGKQITNFKAQGHEDNQKVLQLQLEVAQAEKDADEAEIIWRQEFKEKEKTFALHAEETRKGETQKANNKAELSKLRKKLEIDSQLARDDLQRLQDELSHLKLYRQMSDISLEDDGNFLYNGIQVTSLELSSASSKSSSNHRNCMICSRNEVCVVLLPCTHQVLCLSCYEGNRGNRCPYCRVEIEEGIRVYGPSL